MRLAMCAWRALKAFKTCAWSRLELLTPICCEEGEATTGFSAATVVLVLAGILGRNG